MRASPAFQLVLDRFGLWRAAVFVCAGLVASVMLAWLVTQPWTLPVPALAAAGLLTGGLVALALSVTRMRPVSLRWDGLLWHLGPPVSAGQETSSGALRVLIDLGPWMLLRFDPESASGGRHAVWLPAQRLGLDDASWHALRCAVHSPRPRPADTPADV